MALQFEKNWSDAFRAPSFQSALADVPTTGQLFLIEVYDVRGCSYIKLKRLNERFVS